MKIILGSQSPRRRELMAGIDLPFEAVTIDTEEAYPQDLKEGAIPEFIAREKAQAYLKNLHEDELLITADTIVWHKGKMLGKPLSEEDAKAMLRSLSDDTHQVFTGVCLTYIRDGQVVMDSFVDRTDVTFKALTDEEINYYVSHYKPLDKAGAYGVQEWIGYIGVTAMNGSYFNVMGFPIERVYEFLARTRSK